MIEQKNRNVLGSLILIVLGLIFLLNNFGFLPWSIWADLWRFWPLFLIFWGFKLMFGHSKSANIILLVLTLLLVIYLILNTAANNNPDFNNQLQKNFPFWQNLYHYNPAPNPLKEFLENDDDNLPNKNQNRPKFRIPSDNNFDPNDTDPNFELPY